MTKQELIKKYQARKDHIDDLYKDVDDHDNDYRCSMAKYGAIEEILIDLQDMKDEDNRS